MMLGTPWPHLPERRGNGRFPEGVVRAGVGKAVQGGSLGRFKTSSEISSFGAARGDPSTASTNLRFPGHGPMPARPHRKLVDSYTFSAAKPSRRTKDTIPLRFCTASHLASHQHHITSHHITSQASHHCQHHITSHQHHITSQHHPSITSHHDTKTRCQHHFSGPASITSHHISITSHHF